MLHPTHPPRSDYLATNLVVLVCIFFLPRIVPSLDLTVARSMLWCLPQAVHSLNSQWKSFYTILVHTCIYCISMWVVVIRHQVRRYSRDRFTDISVNSNCIKLRLIRKALAKTDY